MRVVIPAVGILVAALHPIAPLAQSAASCSIGGTITSARTPLPGVVISAFDADGRPVDVSASGVDGAYALRIPGAGRYTLKAEFVAFAPLAREVIVDQANCQQRADLTMTLASRAPQASVPAAAEAAALGAAPNTAPGQTAAPTGRQSGRGQAGGRGSGAGTAGRGQGQQFQSLELLADQAETARPDDGSGSASESAGQLLLPAGFSPDTSAESVTSIGSSQASAGFFGPNGPGDFGDRFGNAFGGGDGAIAGAAGPQGPGGGRGRPGGSGGFGGGPGGFGGPFRGRGGRGNQIRGSVYQSMDSSVLDTAPFALNDQPTVKPDYFQQRLGATLGGPLVIPHIVNSPRTFFFVNYTGNHSRNPYDTYSTVPTVAERAGDLSAIAATLVDPVTGAPFVNNQIPNARLNPAAQKLLNLFPAPNQDGTLNYHNVTTTTSQLDDINIRLVKTLGAVPQRGGRGGGAGGAGGGRGGPGAGRPGASNLNVSVHYRRSDNSSANPLPALGGRSTISAWDIPVGYSFTKLGMTHSLRFGFNQQRAENTNLFANSLNLAANAGLLGVSTDPFDWGAPNLSFSHIASVRDTNPSTRTDRTVSAGDTITKIHGTQTLRFGGDYRSIRADNRTDANARGSFVFTGLYTGSDVADFLLGLPQQASVQFNPNPVSFRSTSWDLFVQDDWRVRDTITVNAGLRYEYFSPLSEANNHLETLDAATGFTAAAPVAAGGTSPYSGLLPDTIVRPFRAGFAPRVGVAWRPKQGTVVRTGYGINYNSSVYQYIAQQLAAQCPCAVTNTLLASPGTLIPIETALQQVQPGSTLPVFGVDPDYRLGYVQIWNLDLQRDLTRTVQLGIGYNGTKGSNLDILRAPNRGPTGLLIPGVPPFIWESSGADSIMHALTLRLRRRLTRGLAMGATYTLSRSIDDASSVAGGGGTVAQNDQDLAAERGLSNFDQRHRFAGDFTIELPFGASKRWFNSGAAAAVLGNWTVNGNAALASGTPFTARVLGSIADVSRGVNGTLRANYDGQPIGVSDPTSALFFNTAAFSVPAPGTFGNAGRNTIIGPGTSSMNLGLTRNITFDQTRGLSIQLLASNVFNTVQFASIDTVVNSPTFGQVTAVRPMRRFQLLFRFRF
jgi:hypothetical protein